ncbi:MAG TPA: Do family serine endopeptidase [Oligoflexia bacterium]|nr:Do family serine endopeptidase [Oligoflexia bacterium]HMP48657.1 Do family serine endopeptidase [Oligoflexia bacterium]
MNYTKILGTTPVDSLRKIIIIFTIVLFVNTFVLAQDKPWIEERDNGDGFPEIQLPSFAPVIERLGRSVVNIQTEGKDESDRGAGLDPSNPFDMLFKNPQNPKRKFSSMGSGFVIHPDGFIVTNHHVVEGANKILVSFKDDKRPKNAKVVGSDTRTDLALLKIEEKGKFYAAPLGNSEIVKPGDWVIAIGNPFRLGHTATVGVVSAVARKLPGGSGAGSQFFDNLIQTDASINPGNSGGPLFNSRGEVIGVNFAILSQGGMFSSAGSVGIGFAIPSNLVKSIITQIKDKGKVVRGWLGVKIQAVTEDMATVLKLEKVDGALVAEVLKGSPAEKANFKIGDVITHFGSQKVSDSSDLASMVADMPVGSRVELTYIRQGKEYKVKVTIEELKEENFVDSSQTDSSEDVSPDAFGLRLQNLNPEIAKSLGLKDSSGVLVADIEPDSVAVESGIRRGDVILEVNSFEIKSISDFKSKTMNIRKSEPLLILIRRGQETFFTTMKIGETN